MMDITTIAKMYGLSGDYELLFENYYDLHLILGDNVIESYNKETPFYGNILGGFQTIFHNTTFLDERDSNYWKDCEKMGDFFEWYFGLKFIDNLCLDKPGLKISHLAEIYLHTGEDLALINDDPYGTNMIYIYRSGNIIEENGKDIARCYGKGYTDCLGNHIPNRWVTGVSLNFVSKDKVGVTFYDDKDKLITKYYHLKFEREDSPEFAKENLKRMGLINLLLEENLVDKTNEDKLYRVLKNWNGGN